MKATRCEWCGEAIGPNEDRVKIPYQNHPGSMTYDVECYCRVYVNRCLRAIVTEGEWLGKPTVGSSLDIVLRALDPSREEE
jgi:hypothetical protein